MYTPGYNAYGTKLFYTYFLKKNITSAPVYLLMKKRNVIEHEKAFIFGTKSTPYFHSQPTSSLLHSLNDGKETQCD